MYYNIEYETERLRGLPWRENCFNPGYFEINLDGMTSFSIMASTDRRAMPTIQRLKKVELDRLAELNSRLEPQLKRLSNAADSFVVKRGDGRSIIAGYHWFDDWGRDTMISMRGLLLVTGRFDDAKSVLETFAGTMKEGVLANDLGASSYNTVDASLWFIQAMFSYFSYTKNKELVRTILAKVAADHRALLGI